MKQRLRDNLTNPVVAIILVAASFLIGTQTRFIPQIVHTGSPKPADFNSLNEIRTLLKQKFDGAVDDQKLLDGAKSGVAAATGDPYTVYLNKDATKALNDDLSGTLTGIGAEVGLRSGQLTIIAPLADSPAAKAGLRSKDQIIKIDGNDPSGLSLDAAVSKIRGAEGTTVTLTIIRDNAQPFEVKIQRAVINVQSVKWSMKSGIGYINVVRFGSDTGDKVNQAATELKAQGAQKFILDLRDDPGGYLDDAVTVASQWLKSGDLVVDERRGSTVVNRHPAVSGGLLIGAKTVVLINGGSASASEIVAGALHDHGVAQLVGEKSYGKGSVQEILPLSGGGNLKVTIAHWYTPNGININKEGIKPDIEIKRVQADYDAGRDPQLDKAMELLR